MTPRRFQELSREESLRRLGSVRVGRIVFSHQALPAIRPVNHLVDDGQVIIRSHAGAALMSALDTVVAYEADFVAEGDRIGWSVIVTGVARRLKVPEAIARYERLLQPWVPDEMAHVIRIQPELVTGFSLEECEQGEPGAA
ncbi:pyridoxamine 5'-phosphate oxidase family protein [Amycolatopsis rhizosphaerae]|uniref:Pyridoxamine 5'-phosphate oxidase family protein n=1 Tax=Amycolatopsis rhizosphaerae TaxID=2053003 RepID=A0A558CRL8_9PSEU|nr:pyridoxamine 5'-phosphate oxidase family protein [Amycolatopsis rhizosphaerae]TVT51396.1 pyridoxamine 5'-phosphate oxidase family protein [Amycolatopsis rhizosphaerae]